MNGRIRIFKVKETRSLDNFKPRVTKRTSIFLNTFKREDIERYNWYKTAIFTNFMGLSGEEIKAIEDRNYGNSFVEVKFLGAI